MKQRGQESSHVAESESSEKEKQGKYITGEKERKLLQGIKVKRERNERKNVMTKLKISDEVSGSE